MAEIRPVTPQDVAELARLNALFNGIQAAPEEYRARLARPGRMDQPLLAWVACGCALHMGRCARPG